MSAKMVTIGILNHDAHQSKTDPRIDLAAML